MSENSNSKLVVVNTFLYRHEAQLAQSNLTAHGIYSMISADDSGGARPYMSFGSSIKLYVFDFDLEKTFDILNVDKDLPAK